MSDVEIKLGDKTETLRCTLRAAKAVNAMGGFQAALQRIGAADLDAFTAIVAAGLGKRPVEIEERVWSTGIAGLSEPLVQYVLLLSNGGRPLSAAVEGGEQQGEG